MSHSTNGVVRRIVVGVDGSPSSSAALGWAVREAELTGDTVLAVIAWQYPIAAGGYGWAPVAMDDAQLIKRHIPSQPGAAVLAGAEHKLTTETAGALLKVGQAAAAGGVADA
jgi:nucleotide-binding universal stress UspA family protein